jgi:hypothetical protein
MMEGMPEFVGVREVGVRNTEDCIEDDSNDKEIIEFQLNL